MGQEQRSEACSPMTSAAAPTTVSPSRCASRLPRAAACWLLAAATPLSVEGWVGMPAAPGRSAGCNGGDNWTCSRGHAATSASRYRRSVQVNGGGATLAQLGRRRGVSCRSQVTADGTSTGTVCYVYEYHDTTVCCTCLMNM